MENEDILKAYTNLANAIIIRAVKDYIAAHKGYKYYGLTPAEIIEDVDTFLNSPYFRILTQVDPEVIQQKLKEMIK